MFAEISGGAGKASHNYMGSEWHFHAFHPKVSEHVLIPDRGHSLYSPPSLSLPLPLSLIIAAEML